MKELIHGFPAVLVHLESPGCKSKSVLWKRWAPGIGDSQLGVEGCYLIMLLRG